MHLKRFNILSVSLLLNLIIVSQNFNLAKSIGGTGDDRANSVITDNSGNIYMTGFFAGVCDFVSGPGTYTLNSQGNMDIFVSKLDSYGNLLWVTQLGGPFYDVGNDIILDNQGDIIVAGTINNGEVFAAKLNPSGTVIWQTQYPPPGSNSNYINSLACDAYNCIYVGGAYAGTLNFGPGTVTLTSGTSQNPLLFKLDANGNFVWAREFVANSSLTMIRELAVDKFEHVIMTGYFEGTADFDGGPSSYTLTPAGGCDIFVAKYTLAGNFVWAKEMGGSGTVSDQGEGIAVDNDGKIYLSGLFGGMNSDFDPGPGTYTYNPTGTADAFIVKLDSAGNFDWAGRIGGLNNTIAWSIAIDIQKNVYVTGHIQSVTDMDPGPGIFTLSPITLNFLTPYVMKLDNSGNFVWAKVFSGNNGSGYGEGIYVDAQQNVFTAGAFGGTMDFDPNTGIYNLTSHGSFDGFLSKLSACNLPAAPVNTLGAVPITCVGATVLVNVSSSDNPCWYATVTPINLLGCGNNYTFTPTTQGVITLYAYATNSCGISAGYGTATITVDPCLGFAENEVLSDIKIYPNPSNQLLNIENTSPQYNFELIITDQLGHMMSECKIGPEHNYQLNTGFLPEGIYFAELRSAEKRQIRKLVIAR